MKDKIILVTGGTGSWGNELVKQLLETDVSQIRIFSRNEFSQVTMERKFDNSKLKFIIGDVRELDAITDACKGVDVVYHLSALKHIPVCEKYPWEAIRTNIDGTRNVIEASIVNNVSKVIDVSSDKAVDPLNLYGMTKAIGEKLIIHANTRTNKTKFICVRGGNVLGSNGSVVPYFINQIKKNNEVQITDKRMTRYFLTLHDAISLLFIAAESDVAGGIFVMKMPACKILDLAWVLMKNLGERGGEIKEIGIRQGEKLHEVLVSKYESPYAYEWSESYYVIDQNKSFEGKRKKVIFEEYNSSENLMDENQIEQMLIKGGFLK
jgi:FlaA1/EpsC-like NDP-sugar epimerase